MDDKDHRLTLPGALAATGLIRLTGSRGGAVRGDSRCDADMTAPSPTPASEPSVDSPLFVLAMDHRASLGGPCSGSRGDPSPTALSKMRDAKALIYEERARWSPTVCPPVG